MDARPRARDGPQVPREPAPIADRPWRKHPQTIVSSITPVSDWLVGRSNEVGMLQGLLAGVTAGVGGTVLVEGEQGIGKTALLREGLAGAAAAGCRVAWGAAEELGQQFPLGLITECLGPEGRLEGMGNGDAASLSHGAGRGSLVIAGDPVLAGVERLLALVDRLCAISPLVLVAEDLQWADEASLLVWHRLSRAATQLPLLVAGSMRPAPAHEDLTRVRRGLLSRGGTLVALQPLPADSVADLVGQLAGSPPGPRLARLVRQAGGNPLYARELTDALIRDRQITMAGAAAELAGDGDRLAVPASLADVIGGRLGSLGEAALPVLRWAALLEQEFSVTDLETVTGQHAGELMGVVAAAVAGGVLAESGPRLGFRHGLIRQVLYEGMPEALRAALHVQAARALAVAGAAPTQVAAHLVAVPEVIAGWVRDWLTQAAPILIYQAPLVAVELLRQAVRQLADDDPHLGTLETALVHVAFVLAQHAEVERAGARALARSQDPGRASEITWLVAYTLLRTGRPAEAAATLEQVLARPGLSVAHAGRLHALQALALTQLGQPDQAEQVADAALADAEAIGDRFAAGYCLHVLSVVDFCRGAEARRLEHIDRALSMIGDALPTTDLRLLLLSNKIAALDNLDRRAEVLSTIQQSLALAESAGTPRLWAIRAAVAHVYFHAGQWDDALAELEAADGLPGARSLPYLLHTLSALIAVHRGEQDDLDTHLAALAEVSARDPMVRANVHYLLLARALVVEHAGEPGRAAAELAQSLDPGFAQDIAGRYLLLPTLVRLALAAGDVPVAAAAAEAAAAEAQSMPLPARAAAADHCRGLMTADPAPLLAAARYHQSAGRPLNQAQALEDAAVLLAQAGDSRGARDTLTEAVGLYESLDARWDIRRAYLRLRPHGIRRGPAGSRAHPTAGWDALTRTETKIAYLVAAGQSNPDIAAELFLSRNTVQTHVSHILAKLGARSRAEIVREALQHPPRSAQAVPSAVPADLGGEPRGISGRR